MSVEQRILHHTSWLAEPIASRRIVRQLFESLRGRWSGCDWEAPLGPERNCIRGLRARHAHMLSAATSGDESLAWLDAANYLETLEKHARQAESAAGEAVLLVEVDRWSAAIGRIEFALELEAQYREPQTWLPLSQLIGELAARAG